MCIEMGLEQNLKHSWHKFNLNSLKPDLSESKLITITCFRNMLLETGVKIILFSDNMDGRALQPMYFNEYPLANLLEKGFTIFPLYMIADIPSSSKIHIPYDFIFIAKDAALNIFRKGNKLVRRRA